MGFRIWSAFWKPASLFYCDFGPIGGTGYPTSLDMVQLNRQNARSASEKQALKDRDDAARVYNRATVKLLAEKRLLRPAARLKDCGDDFHKVVCKNDGTVIGYQRSHCGLDRLCPTCARIKRSELLKDVHEHIKIISDKPILGYSWRVLTLPVKTDGKYRRAANTALKGFSALWRTLLKGGKGLSTAAIVHLENGPKTGNVHLHCLYYGPWIDQAQLSDRWAKLTGSPVVHVQRVHERNLRDAAREALKYMTKFTEIDNAKLLDIWEANKGLNLLRRYGLFRKDCLEVFSGQLLKKREKREVTHVCPDCGESNYEFVLINDQGGRAPPLEILAGSVEW